MLCSHRSGTWSASSYSFVSTCKCSRGYCCTSSPWVLCWYCRYSRVLLSAAIWLTMQVLWMPWLDAKLRLYLLEREYSWHARNHSHCFSPTKSPASMSLTVAALEEEINKHPGLLFSLKICSSKSINFCIIYNSRELSIILLMLNPPSVLMCVCVCTSQSLCLCVYVRVCVCVLMLL